MSAAESIDLGAIEARLAGRTPGDWELGDGWVYTNPIYADDTRLTPIGHAARYSDPARQAAEWDRVQRDLELIAAAPTDLSALLAELRATTADLAVAVEVARERGEEVERLNRRLGMTRNNAADDLAELRDENERLRAVAEAARVLIPSGDGDSLTEYAIAWTDLRAALDAWRAGGGTE